MRNSVLRQALQMARRRDRADRGLPPPIAASLPAIGRRHLLKLIGAGMGTLAAPPAIAAEPAKRVAIIGGGLAGLNALRLLTEAGLDAMLYEARDRIGGRVWTVPSGSAPGLTVEMGGQFVNSDHADMIVLAKLYHLDLFDRRALRCTEQVVRDRRALPPAEVAEALAPIAAQIAKDSEAIDADHAAAAPALDRLSVADYLARHAALVRGPVARDLLLQTIRTEYGAEAAESSALQLIFNLPTVHGEAFETLGDSDERFVVKGGSQKVTDAMAAALGERIKTGKALVAMKPVPGGVHLRFADGSTAEAERVILTLPASVLRTIDHGGLLGAPWRAYAQEVKLGRCAKLNAPYRARVWEEAMSPGGSTWDASAAAPFAEVWHATLGQGGDAAGVLTWYLGGDQCNELGSAYLQDRIELAVGDAMGGLTAARLGGAARTGWLRDPFSRGAYLNFRPGQFTRFGSLLWVEENGVPVQLAKSGPVLLAGEHLSDAWPGFMNGGAQTGRLAAQALLGGA